MKSFFQQRHEQAPGSRCRLQDSSFARRQPLQIIFNVPERTADRLIEVVNF
ncbi:PilI type IV pilus biogenesis protein [Planococcus sp. CPCC 101016]|uniref:type IV pilus biogenesis protein PilI n=1 Tax=Planococcus sp. CPCC 101016 TaxID=2599617 RepID=UPI0037C7428B